MGIMQLPLTMDNEFVKTKLCSKFKKCSCYSDVFTKNVT